MASTSSIAAPIELQTQPVAQGQGCTHKIKTIEFLGRQIPIILQNQNGPCPLLAICNVLLLRNNLNLSQEMVEVSQEKLLSLVAERLIDSDSNIANKEVGFLENQQQNLADAMDMLPRLATGIDVNIRFRRIHDFEFTSESAIFDLLNIPLCHGWIVDPQDSETAIAIGSKSYNALMGELVALEARILEGESRSDDTIDFAAATAAMLGVPSPHLPQTSSFDEVGSTCAEQAVILSLPFSSCKISSDTTGGERVDVATITVDKVADMLELPEPSMDIERSVDEEDTVTSNVRCNDPSFNVTNKTCPDELMLPSPPLCNENSGGETEEGEHIGSGAISEPHFLEPADVMTSDKDAPEAVASSVCGNDEALYEGEECMLNWETNVGEELEPMYEGEANLAEQIEKATRSEDDLIPEQGKLIRNFFRINASQLTFYGLFCLQEGLKERELCVFFRNNHFNTMFKYNSELYLLVTDQGYQHEPNLVWEKLNEINGDTLFMTSSFKEFKGGSHDNDALASVVDYDCLGSVAAETSDLQLAIALQQQEFNEEQSQTCNSKQSSLGGHSSAKVITPQPPKSEKSKSSSSRAMAKSKDRCTIM